MYYIDRLPYNYNLYPGHNEALAYISAAPLDRGGTVVNNTEFIVTFFIVIVPFDPAFPMVEQTLHPGTSTFVEFPNHATHVMISVNSATDVLGNHVRVDVESAPCQLNIGGTVFLSDCFQILSHEDFIHWVNDNIEEGFGLALGPDGARATGEIEIIIEDALNDIEYIRNTLGRPVEAQVLQNRLQQLQQLVAQLRGA